MKCHDSGTWLCLQWGISYTDADHPAPIVSHDPQLEFGQSAWSE